MGLGIVHYSPLWAQSERKLLKAYNMMTVVDSVWSLVLRMGDRLEYFKDERMNQFSLDMMIGRGFFGNPCMGYGGQFEHFSTTYSMLAQGYPYYFARSKEDWRSEEEGGTINPLMEEYRRDIEVVQMWTWFDQGNVCCKIAVPDEDDWFSSFFAGSAFTGFPEFDWEDLLAEEGAYLPVKKYPIATWDVLDTSQLLAGAARASAGE